MFALGRLPVERSRMIRRVHRGLPNVLKARFSPTAVWTTPGGDEPTSSTDEGLFPFLRPTTTSTTRTPSTSTSRTPSPTTPPTTVAAPHTTSSSSVSTSSSSTFVPTTSSTSSTPSTSSARTSATPTPTTTTPNPTHSTSSRTTALVTSTVSSHTSATSLGSEASASSTATSSSGITTAGAIGIAAAAIVGFIAVISIAMFLVRRWNRRKDEYDPDEFRRQSQALRDDSPMLQRGNSGGRGGFAPRPPTMFERHHQNIATFAMPPPPNAYQSNADAYGSANSFGDYASQQHSPFYAPGPAALLAPSPQYANVSPYNMQLLAGSPVSMGPYGGAAYNAQDRLARTPSNAAVSVLSRNHSVAQPPYPVEEADYVDLTRSSVTPFQAAQYEAISKQLNIPPPQPLQQVSEADETDESNQAKEDKPATTVSPFEDPQAGDSQQAPANETGAGFEAARASSEVHAEPEPGSRVTSSPPSLPEIKMMSGTFSPVVLSFPVTPSPRKGSFDLHSGRASPKVDLPPLSPSSTSPQRAQFVDGVEARAHDGHETPVEIGFVGSGASKAGAAPSSAAKVEAPEHKGEPSKSMASTPNRPSTDYSDDDAYGGF